MNNLERENERLKALLANAICGMICGDYNAEIDEICEYIGSTREELVELDVLEDNE